MAIRAYGTHNSTLNAASHMSGCLRSKKCSEWVVQANVDTEQLLENGRAVNNRPGKRNLYNDG